MNDPLTRLRQLPLPVVEPQLTARVLANARRSASRARMARFPRLGNRLMGLAVAAMSLMQLVWTVFFLNQLAR